MGTKPTRYYPPARPKEGEAPGVSRAIKITFADKRPPSVTAVKAHQRDERIFASRQLGQLAAEVVVTNYDYKTYAKAHVLDYAYGARYYLQQSLRPPSVTDVTAHEVKHRYGALFYTYPAPVVVEGYEFKTYTKAHDILHNYGARYYLQRLLDLAPPSTTHVDAHDPLQRYGAQYYVQRLLDLQPPSVKRVTAFSYEQIFGTRYIIQRLYDLAPPSVQKIIAHDVDQRYGASYRIFPAPVVVTDLAYQTYVEAHSIDERYGGRYYLYPVPEIAAGYEYKTYVKAHEPAKRYKTVISHTAYADLRPPEIHRVIAHDIEHRYGAKAYEIIAPAAVNFYPPYSTYVKAHDIVQRYGAKAYVQRLFDLASPQVVRVKQFTLPQFELGPRTYKPPFITPLPITSFVKAFDLPQRLLSTRAYIQRLYDLQPPSVARVSAHRLDHRYGAKQSGIILPEIVNYYPPYSTYVKAHQPEQKFLLSRAAYPPFADRKPPRITTVRAFSYDRAYGAKQSGIRLPIGSAPPPSVTTVEAFELPQKLNLPRFVIVTPDRKPPETTYAIGHDPVHKLLGSRYFLPAAFVIVTYGTPYESLVSIAATASEEYESLFGVASSWIDPYEALQGVTSTWLDSYEALQGISSGINNPYESSGTGILSLYDLPWEALGAILALFSEPAENLQSVSASTASPYETLQGVASSYSTPWEAITVLSSLNLLPYESVQHLSNVVSAIYEALQGVATQQEYPWEANVGVTSTHTEWYEARGQVTSDLVLPLEALADITQTFADQPFEVLLGLALTGQLPWEAASTIVPQHMFEAVLYAHWYVQTTKHLEGRISTGYQADLLKHLQARIFTRYATEPKQGRRYPNP